MEKIPKFNKRRAFNKTVGSGKNSKSINVGPTFILESRVPTEMDENMNDYRPDSYFSLHLQGLLVKY
jgi:hypothetical protein